VFQQFEANFEKINAWEKLKRQLSQELHSEISQQNSASGQLKKSKTSPYREIAEFVLFDALFQQMMRSKHCKRRYPSSSRAPTDKSGEMQTTSDRLTSAQSKANHWQPNERPMSSTWKDSTKSYWIKGIRVIVSR
jgi:hypothetical protein